MLYYEHLDLVREKNPVLGFLLRNPEKLQSKKEQRFPQFEKAEVYFLYNVQDPEIFLELLEQNVPICLIYADVKIASLFLHERYAKEFLSHPKVAIHLLSDQEEEYIQIAWRYIFMKKRHVNQEHDANSVKERLENTFFSVELVVSDYRNLGVDILSNVYSNLMRSQEIFLVDEKSVDLSKVPVLICGAGPSLVKNLDLLYALQEKMVIVGCGSAIEMLINKGIYPHLAVFIDPDPPLEKLQKLDRFSMPLLYQNRVSKDVFRLHQGKKIWMGSAEGYPSEMWLLENLGVERFFFDAGWNVANFALFSLYHMNARQMYLIGVDSAYQQESVKHDEWKMENQQGKSIVTRKDLFLGAKWISDFAKQHPDLELINLSSEGLAMEAVLTMSLDLVKTKIKDIQPEKIVEELFINMKKIQIDPSLLKILLDRLKLSFLTSKALIEECLKVRSSFSYALFEADIENEIAYQFVLAPLWQIWKPILLKHEKQDEDLQKVLFFQLVAGKHLQLINEVYA
ncbi:MAG: DUF115 domain-containing protein [Chlamydiae bacterium]|nr:DUF115 domain-containing protein [Chlamydiota bacterium]